jgi:transposase InsO family protein
MPAQAFSKSDSQVTKPFEKIHMDLKSMPMVSYHKYKYFIVFFDNFTSHGWTMDLKLKFEAEKAIRQFNAIVKNQCKTSVISIQIDGKSEFQSISLQELFKDLGIKVFLSTPHMHQQNGRAEHFIRTIMDKAQAIRFDACIPQSWWEFTVAHAVHLHNRTPVWRIDYKTPHEMLKLQRPDVSYFRVFRYRAYVFLPEEDRTNWHPSLN